MLGALEELTRSVVEVQREPLCHGFLLLEDLLANACNVGLAGLFCRLDKRLVAGYFKMLKAVAGHASFHDLIAGHHAAHALAESGQLAAHVLDYRSVGTKQGKTLLDLLHLAACFSNVLLDAL